MTEIAWLRPDKGRIIVNPNAAMQFSSLPVPNLQGQQALCLGIAVTMPQAHLAFTRPILAECDAKSVVPKVHVWDREKATAQFAVLFVLRDPTHKFLLRLLPAHRAHITRQKWHELRLLFTSACPSPVIERFCTMYKTMPRATILVLRSPKDMGMVVLGPEDRIATFVAEDVEFVKPIAILDPDER